MHREPRREHFPTAREIGQNLVTLAVLMLVGLGFTLMSATAFA
jgi:hypothetical protein